jgi:hypothetical protein
VIYGCDEAAGKATTPPRKDPECPSQGGITSIIHAAQQLSWRLSQIGDAFVVAGAGGACDLVFEQQ